jgi:lipoprotein signal peptidase
VLNAGDTAPDTPAVERRPVPITKAAWVVFVIVLVDQIAKSAADRAHAGMITPARNPDYALGIVGGPAPLLILGTVLVLALFLAVIGRWAVQVGISPLIPAVIAGGMVANTIDRIRFGAVRDFLATGWLIIDVADLVVFGGIVALVVALALRVRQLRRDSCTIALEIPTLRARVVRTEAA